MTPLDASKAMYACVAARDWDGVAAFFADDFVIHEPASLPYGGAWRGKDALRRLYTSVMAFWDDPVVAWDGLAGGERHAVALLTLTATARTTGRRFTMETAEVTTFDDAGLMTAMRIHYFDTAALLRVLAP